MPEPLKRRLQTLLLGLENTAEGRRILESAHLTGFNPANDAVYDSHRAIVRRVLGKDE